MNLKEKLEEARKNLANVKAAFDAGTKTAADLQAAVNAVNKAEANYDAAVEAEKLIKSMGTKPDGGDGEGGEPPAESLGANFIKFIKNEKVKDRFHISAPAFKAANDPILSPVGAAGFATTYDQTLVEGLRTPLVVRNLFGAENISGSTLVYLVEGATEGAAAVTAEGTIKSQIHFGDPVPKTVSLSKITCFIRESDEYIHDYLFLESAINGRLLYELGLKEQSQLIADLTGTSGIQSDSLAWGAAGDTADVADLILGSAMDIQSVTGFAADAIVMHPEVWYSFRVAKNANKDYYGGGFFGAESVPNLWGIPVCVTNAVTPSQILVGAFKTCGSVVSNAGVSVEAVNTNADDFERNLMTIRAEERLALAVRRPAGFKLLTK